MRPSIFASVAVGTRFRAFDAHDISVHTKISDEYETDIASGYPVPNAISEVTGSNGFKADAPILVLTDEEVVDAKRVEHSIRIGQSIGNDNVQFFNGVMYLAVRVLNKDQIKL